MHGGCRNRPGRALAEPEPVVEPPQGTGRVPGRSAEQTHRGGDEHTTYGDGIDEDGQPAAQAEQLPVKRKSGTKAVQAPLGAPTVLRHLNTTGDIGRLTLRGAESRARSNCPGADSGLIALTISHII